MKKSPHTQKLRTSVAAFPNVPAHLDRTVTGFPTNSLNVQRTRLLLKDTGGGIARLGVQNAYGTPRNRV